MSEGVTELKRCMFCNCRLASKSGEHVLPKRLIDITGNENRKGHFGWLFTPGGPRRRLSPFTKLTVPACSDCNNKHSDLEKSASRIVGNMLQWEPICVGETDTLLDWVDKVRVGLWFAGPYLQGNPDDVNPGFGAAIRMGGADRLVVLYGALGAARGYGSSCTSRPARAPVRTECTQIRVWRKGLLKSHSRQVFCGQDHGGFASTSGKKLQSPSC